MKAFTHSNRYRYEGSLVESLRIWTVCLFCIVNVNIYQTLFKLCPFQKHVNRPFSPKSRWWHFDAILPIVLLSKHIVPCCLSFFTVFKNSLGYILCNFKVSFIIRLCNYQTFFLQQNKWYIWAVNAVTNVQNMYIFSIFPKFGIGAP